MEIKPQPGPQTEFLSTLADIAIYGGAAGSGKSYALLLEPIRHWKNSVFSGVVFRRNATQVRNPGGLWDESRLLYPLLNAESRELAMEWTFPSGMKMKFAHLEHSSSALDWQGAQVPFIGFDELTHFEESQFWYMLSRNRSVSGVRGYVRCTTNPDADSWVRHLIDWWIDPNTGYPIPERSGKLRWFIRLDNTLYWADTRQELLDLHGQDCAPKSLTFISARLADNKILVDKDPSYRANLLALPRVERERLLGGNWNIRPNAGNFFQRRWFTPLESTRGLIITRAIRYWDRAATKPNEVNPDPDWTVGVKLGQTDQGKFVILDVMRLRNTPGVVEQTVLATAQQDGYGVSIGLEQDPGSAGKADIENMVTKLAGFRITVNKPTRDKATRAGPISAQAEHGNVFIVRAAWNDAFFSEAENFPVEQGLGHDDQIDALSGAFAMITKSVSICDVLDTSPSGIELAQNQANISGLPLEMQQLFRTF